MACMHERVTNRRSFGAGIAPRNSVKTTVHGGFDGRSKLHRARDGARLRVAPTTYVVMHAVRACVGKGAKGLWRLYLMAIFVATLAGCGGNEFKSPPPPKVTVANPRAESVADYIETTGTTEAVDSVEFRARVNGYLDKKLFADGQSVKAGDVLFVIDKAPFEATLKAREAERAKAEAAARLSEIEAGRAERLSKQNAIAVGELQRRQAELSAARADLQAADAAVAQAKLELGYTEIRAPFDGRVGRNLVDPGNLVQAGTTVLGTIQRDHALNVYFFLSEADYLRLSKTRRESATPQHVSVSLAVMNSDSFDYQGKVDFEAPRIEQSTGTVQWRGVFDNPSLKLIPGLFVRVRAAVGDPQPRLSLPDEAIASDQRGQYVYVVKEDDTVERRSVVLGPLHERRRIVIEGIQANDRVVINGLQKARPGSKVAPEQADQKVALAGAPTPVPAT